jgi:hypothetical protein
MLSARQVTGTKVWARRWSGVSHSL